MPLFLFTGSDSYRIQQKIEYWKKSFAEKHGGSANITLLDGKKIELAEIRSAFETLPLLAEKRLIIIRDFLKNAKPKNEEDGEEVENTALKDQKKLATALENLSDDCILVFVEPGSFPDRRSALVKKIQKNGKIEVFETLEGASLTQWILDTVKEHGGKISPANADFLARHIGSNLWQLGNEIEKLVTFADQREITEKDILLLTKANIKTTIFKLTDYFGQKNARLAIETLDTLTKNSEDIFYIFFMIVRHFRILIQVKSLLEQKKSQQNILTELHLHPFVIDTAIRQCRNFPLTALKTIYGKLLTIDESAKTGKIKTSTLDTRPMNLVLETFILDCCKR
ncbi:DNA polymerase III subunit delta [Candidatus Peregrinibacteria bacterium]|nr:DNA polymerase III subunit delta [Candidatus Peregrinibacteria bacterium]